MLSLLSINTPHSLNINTYSSPARVFLVNSQSLKELTLLINRAAGQEVLFIDDTLLENSQYLININDPAALLLFDFIGIQTKTLSFLKMKINETSLIKHQKLDWKQFNRSKLVQQIGLDTCILISKNSFNIKSKIIRKFYKNNPVIKKLVNKEIQCVRYTTNEIKNLSKKQKKTLEHLTPIKTENNTLNYYHSTIVNFKVGKNQYTDGYCFMPLYHSGNKYNDPTGQSDKKYVKKTIIDELTESKKTKNSKKAGKRNDKHANNKKPILSEYEIARSKWTPTISIDQFFTLLRTKNRYYDEKTHIKGARAEVYHIKCLYLTCFNGDLHLDSIESNTWDDVEKYKFCAAQKKPLVFTEYDYNSKLPWFDGKLYKFIINTKETLKNFENLFKPDYEYKMPEELIVTTSWNDTCTPFYLDEFGNEIEKTFDFNVEKPIVDEENIILNNLSTSSIEKPTQNIHMKPIKRVGILDDTVEEIENSLLTNIKDNITNNNDFKNKIYEFNNQQLDKKLNKFNPTLFKSNYHLNKDQVNILQKAFPNYQITKFKKEYINYPLTECFKELLIEEMYAKLGNNVLINSILDDQYLLIKRNKINVHNCSLNKTVQKKAKFADDAIDILNYIGKKIHKVNSSNDPQEVLNMKSYYESIYNSPKLIMCNESYLNCNLKFNSKVIFGMTVNSINEISPNNLLIWHFKKRIVKASHTQLMPIESLYEKKGSIFNTEGSWFTDNHNIINITLNNCNEVMLVNLNNMFEYYKTPIFVHEDKILYVKVLNFTGPYINLNSYIISKTQFDSMFLRNCIWFTRSNEEMIFKLPIILTKMPRSITGFKPFKVKYVTVLIPCLENLNIKLLPGDVDFNELLRYAKTLLTTVFFSNTSVTKKYNLTVEQMADHCVIAMTMNTKLHECLEPLVVLSKNKTKNEFWFKSLASAMVNYILNFLNTFDPTSSPEFFLNEFIANFATSTKFGKIQSTPLEFKNLHVLVKKISKYQNKLNKNPQMVKYQIKINENKTKLQFLRDNLKNQNLNQYPILSPSEFEELDNETKQSMLDPKNKMYVPNEKRSWINQNIYESTLNEFNKKLENIQNQGTRLLEKLQTISENKYLSTGDKLKECFSEIFTYDPEQANALTMNLSNIKVTDLHMYDRLKQIIFSNCNQALVEITPKIITNERITANFDETTILSKENYKELSHIHLNTSEGNDFITCKPHKRCKHLHIHVYEHLDPKKNETNNFVKCQCCEIESYEHNKNFCLPCSKPLICETVNTCPHVHKFIGEHCCGKYPCNCVKTNFCSCCKHFNLGLNCSVCHNDNLKSNTENLITNPSIITETLIEHINQDNEVEDDMHIDDIIVDNTNYNNQIIEDFKNNKLFYNTNKTYTEEDLNQFDIDTINANMHSQNITSISKIINEPSYIPQSPLIKPLEITESNNAINEQVPINIISSSSNTETNVEGYLMLKGYDIKKKTSPFIVTDSKHPINTGELHIWNIFDEGDEDQLSFEEKHKLKIIINEFNLKQVFYTEKTQRFEKKFHYHATIEKVNLRENQIMEFEPYGEHLDPSCLNCDYLYKPKPKHIIAETNNTISFQITANQSLILSKNHLLPINEQIKNDIITGIERKLSNKLKLTVHKEDYVHESYLITVHNVIDNDSSDYIWDDDDENDGNDDAESTDFETDIETLIKSRKQQYEQVAEHKEKDNEEPIDDLNNNQQQNEENESRNDEKKVSTIQNIVKITTDNDIDSNAKQQFQDTTLHVVQDIQTVKTINTTPIIDNKQDETKQSFHISSNTTEQEKEETETTLTNIQSINNGNDNINKIQTTTTQHNIIIQEPLDRNKDDTLSKKSKEKLPESKFLESSRYQSETKTQSVHTFPITGISILQQHEKNQNENKENVQDNFNNEVKLFLETMNYSILFSEAQDNNLEPILIPEGFDHTTMPKEVLITYVGKAEGIGRCGWDCFKTILNLDEEDFNEATSLLNKTNMFNVSDLLILANYYELNLMVITKSYSILIQNNMFSNTYYSILNMNTKVSDLNHWVPCNAKITSLKQIVDDIYSLEYYQKLRQEAFNLTGKLMDFNELIPFSANMIHFNFKTMMSLEQQALLKLESYLTYNSNVNVLQGIIKNFSFNNLKNYELKLPKFNINYAPCGFGKTMKFHLSRKNKNDVSLIIIPTISAILNAYNYFSSQNYRVYARAGGIDYANYDQKKQKAEIHLRTKNSLVSYITNFKKLPYCNQIMLDEIHEFDHDYLMAFNKVVELKEKFSIPLLCASATINEKLIVHESKFRVQVNYVNDNYMYQPILSELVKLKPANSIIIIIIPSIKYQTAVMKDHQLGLFNFQTVSSELYQSNKKLFETRYNSDPAINGQTDIFLCTNFLESGVTIPNLYCLIDLGFRIKKDLNMISEINTDVLFKYESIRYTTAEKVQARGRVGRTMNGIYYGNDKTSDEPIGFLDNLLYFLTDNAVPFASQHKEEVKMILNGFKFKFSLTHLSPEAEYLREIKPNDIEGQEQLKRFKEESLQLINYWNNLFDELRKVQKRIQYHNDLTLNNLIQIVVLKNTDFNKQKQMILSNPSLKISTPSFETFTLESLFQCSTCKQYNLIASIYLYCRNCMKDTYNLLINDVFLMNTKMLNLNVNFFLPLNKYSNIPNTTVIHSISNSTDLMKIAYNSIITLMNDEQKFNKLPTGKPHIYTDENFCVIPKKQNENLNNVLLSHGMKNYETFYIKETNHSEITTYNVKYPNKTFDYIYLPLKRNYYNKLRIFSILSFNNWDPLINNYNNIKPEFIEGPAGSGKTFTLILNDNDVLVVKQNSLRNKILQGKKYKPKQITNPNLRLYTEKIDTIDTLYIEEYTSWNMIDIILLKYMYKRIVYIGDHRQITRNEDDDYSLINFSIKNEKPKYFSNEIKRYGNNTCLFLNKLFGTQLYSKKNDDVVSIILIDDDLNKFNKLLVQLNKIGVIITFNNNWMYKIKKITEIPISTPEKYQGDQSEHVLVYLSHIDKYTTNEKFLYTAFTRHENQLTIVINKKIYNQTLIYKHYKNTQLVREFESGLILFNIEKNLCCNFHFEYDLNKVIKALNIKKNSKQFLTYLVSNLKIFFDLIQKQVLNMTSNTNEYILNQLYAFKESNLGKKLLKHKQFFLLFKTITLLFIKDKALKKELEQIELYNQTEMIQNDPDIIETAISFQHYDQETTIDNKKKRQYWMREDALDIESMIASIKDMDESSGSYINNKHTFIEEIEEDDDLQIGPSNYTTLIENSDLNDEHKQIEEIIKIESKHANNSDNLNNESKTLLDEYQNPIDKTNFYKYFKKQLNEHKEKTILEIISEIIDIKNKIKLSKKDLDLIIQLSENNIVTNDQQLSIKTDIRVPENFQDLIDQQSNSTLGKLIDKSKTTFDKHINSNIVTSLFNLTNNNFENKNLFKELEKYNNILNNNKYDIIKYNPQLMFQHLTSHINVTDLTFNLYFRKLLNNEITIKEFKCKVAYLTILFKKSLSEIDQDILQLKKDLEETEEEEKKTEIKKKIFWAVHSHSNVNSLDNSTLSGKDLQDYLNKMERSVTNNFEFSDKLLTKLIEHENDWTNRLIKENEEKMRQLTVDEEENDNKDNLPNETNITKENIHQIINESEYAYKGGNPFDDDDFSNKIKNTPYLLSYYESIKNFIFELDAENAFTYYKFLRLNKIFTLIPVKYRLCTKTLLQYNNLNELKEQSIKLFKQKGIIKTYDDENRYKYGDYLLGYCCHNKCIYGECCSMNSKCLFHTMEEGHEQYQEKIFDNVQNSNLKIDYLDEKSNDDNFINKSKKILSNENSKSNPMEIINNVDNLINNELIIYKSSNEKNSFKYNLILKLLNLRNKLSKYLTFQNIKLIKSKIASIIKNSKIFTYVDKLVNYLINNTSLPINIIKTLLNNLIMNFKNDKKTLIQLTKNKIGKTEIIYQFTENQIEALLQEQNEFIDDLENESGYVLFFSFNKQFTGLPELNTFKTQLLEMLNNLLNNIHNNMEVVGTFMGKKLLQIKQNFDAIFSNTFLENLKIKLFKLKLLITDSHSLRLYHLLESRHFITSQIRSVNVKPKEIMLLINDRRNQTVTTHLSKLSLATDFDKLNLLNLNFIIQEDLVVLSIYNNNFETYKRFFEVNEKYILDVFIYDKMIKNNEETVCYLRVQKENDLNKMEYKIMLDDNLTLVKLINICIYSNNNFSIKNNNFYFTTQNDLDEVIYNISRLNYFLLNDTVFNNLPVCDTEPLKETLHNLIDNLLRKSLIVEYQSGSLFSILSISLLSVLTVSTIVYVLIKKIKNMFDIDYELNLSDLSSAPLIYEEEELINQNIPSSIPLENQMTDMEDKSIKKQSISYAKLNQEHSQQMKDYLTNLITNPTYADEKYNQIITCSKILTAEPNTNIFENPEHVQNQIKNLIDEPSQPVKIFKVSDYYKSNEQDDIKAKIIQHQYNAIKIQSSNYTYSLKYITNNYLEQLMLIIPNALQGVSNFNTLLQNNPELYNKNKIESGKLIYNIDNNIINKYLNVIEIPNMTLTDSMIHTYLTFIKDNRNIQDEEYIFQLFYDQFKYMNKEELELLLKTLIPLNVRYEVAKNLKSKKIHKSQKSVNLFIKNYHGNGNVVACKDLNSTLNLFEFSKLFQGERSSLTIDEIKIYITEIIMKSYDQFKCTYVETAEYLKNNYYLNESQNFIILNLCKTLYKLHSMVKKLILLTNNYDAKIKAQVNNLYKHLINVTKNTKNYIQTIFDWFVAFNNNHVTKNNLKLNKDITDTLNDIKSTVKNCEEILINTTINKNDQFTNDENENNLINENNSKIEQIFNNPQNNIESLSQHESNKQNDTNLNKENTIFNQTKNFIEKNKLIKNDKLSGGIITHKELLDALKKHFSILENVEKPNKDIDMRLNYKVNSLMNIKIQLNCEFIKNCDYYEETMDINGVTLQKTDLRLKPNVNIYNYIINSKVGKAALMFNDATNTFEVYTTDSMWIKIAINTFTKGNGTDLHFIFDLLDNYVLLIKNYLLDKLDLMLHYFQFKYTNIYTYNNNVKLELHEIYNTLLDLNQNELFKIEMNYLKNKIILKPYSIIDGNINIDKHTIMEIKLSDLSYQSFPVINDININGKIKQVIKENLKMIYSKISFRVHSNDKTLMSFLSEEINFFLKSVHNNNYNKETMIEINNNHLFLDEQNKEIENIVNVKYQTYLKELMNKNVITNINEIDSGSMVEIFNRFLEKENNLLMKQENFMLTKKFSNLIDGMLNQLPNLTPMSQMLENENKDEVKTDYLNEVNNYLNTQEDKLSIKRKQIIILASAGSGKSTFIKTNKDLDLYDSDDYMNFLHIFNLKNTRKHSNTPNYIKQLYIDAWNDKPLNCIYFTIGLQFLPKDVINDENNIFIYYLPKIIENLQGFDDMQRHVIEKEYFDNKHRSNVFLAPVVDIDKDTDLFRELETNYKQIQFKTQNVKIKNITDHVKKQLKYKESSLKLKKCLKLTYETIYDSISNINYHYEDHHIIQDEIFYQDIYHDMKLKFNLDAKYSIRGIPRQGIKTIGYLNFYPTLTRPANYGLYDSSIQAITNKMLQIQKLRKHKPNHDTQLKFFKQAFFHEYADNNIKYFNDNKVTINPDLIYPWLIGRNQANIESSIKDYNSKVTNRMINKIKLYEKAENVTKGDIYTDYSDILNRIVLWNPYCMHLIFAPFFMYLKTRCKQLLKNKVIYAEGYTINEINHLLQNNFKKKKNFKFFESDLAKQDRQTDKHALDFEQMFYKDVLGGSHEVVDIYFKQHEKAFVKSDTIRANIPPMRHTGQTTVGFGNFINNLRVYSKFFSTHDFEFVMVLGDDLLGYIESIDDNTLLDLSKETEIYHNMKSTYRLNDKTGIFCQFIVGHIQDTLFFVPNIIRLEDRMRSIHEKKQNAEESIKSRIINYLHLIGRNKNTEYLSLINNVKTPEKRHYNEEIIITLNSYYHENTYESIEESLNNFYYICKNYQINFIDFHVLLKEKFKQASRF